MSSPGPEPVAGRSALSGGESEPRVAILGVGLIGGSVGLAARELLGAEAIGFDLDPEACEKALAIGALDRAAASVEEACAGASLVVCAVPVGALPGLVARALATAPPEAVVTDVGSTKRDLVAAHGRDERFIGGHPLTGAESAGVEGARADLFSGARWYLAPTEHTGGVGYDRLQRAIAGLGARPQAIEAEAHDRLMATVSHLPHVMANVMASQAAEELSRDAERMPDVGPSFRDSTRVAGANLAIWGDIYAGNAEAVAEAAEEAAGRLHQAAALLRAGDREAVAGWHQAAAADRRRILEAEGVSGPLIELHARVENRPGALAELALALGRARLNIEDMALAPASDMSTGQVSLWIAGEEQAAAALDLIRELGHTASRPDSGEILSNDGDSRPDGGE